MAMGMSNQDTDHGCSYQYDDKCRQDILQLVPSDGVEIGSFGCGTGATEAALVSNGRRVHGIDVSREAIEIARRRLTSARTVHEHEVDCFAPNSLDGLILADVLEHLPLSWRRLAAMSRWVRRGGWVVISVPNMRNYRVLATFVIGGDWPEHRAGTFDETHLQVMTRRRLDRWCRSAGLLPQAWPFRPPPVPTWRRSLFVALNAVLLGVASEWLTYQHQVVCRKV